MSKCPMRNKSDENWRIVSLYLQNGALNAAANRLYYAVFQAVLAYAKAKKEYIRDPDVSVHIKMSSYVRDTPDGKFYERVYKLLIISRTTADYEPETPPDPRIGSLYKDSGSMRQYFFNLAES